MNRKIYIIEWSGIAYEYTWYDEELTPELKRKIDEKVQKLLKDNPEMIIVEVRDEDIRLEMI
ncbi:MAG: hypothetical protein Q6363_005730 [Candidatus Njordarchaeota archaeon]